MGEKSVSAILENGSAKIKNGTATFRFGTDTLLGGLYGGSRYLCPEGHATFRPKVSLPLPKRSGYLLPEGQVTLAAVKMGASYAVSA